MPTALIPCGDRIDCPGTDSPFMNLSAEEPDVQQFWEAAYAQPRMPLGAGWGFFGGMAIGTSDTSQSDAGGQAQLTVTDNTLDPPPADLSDITPPPGDPDNDPPIPDDLPRDPARRPPIRRRRKKPPTRTTSPPLPNRPPFTPTPRQPPRPFFANEEQTCVKVCPSGTTFTAIVASGTVFSRHSVAEANTMAASKACSEAIQNPICFGGILEKTCADVAYDYQIPVQNGIVVGWNLTGSLPPGITFLDGVFSGVPTIPGTYDFDVEAFDASGNFASDSFSIQVVQITTNSLPGGTIATPYSTTLHELGGTTPVSWQVSSGALPPGLFLDEATGVISGTPTIVGNYTFEILLQDAAT